MDDGDDDDTDDDDDDTDDDTDDDKNQKNDSYTAAGVVSINFSMDHKASNR